MFFLFVTRSIKFFSNDASFRVSFDFFRVVFMTETANDHFIEKESKSINHLKQAAMLRLWNRSPWSSYFRLKTGRIRLRSCAGTLVISVHARLVAKKKELSSVSGPAHAAQCTMHFTSWDLGNSMPPGHFTRLSSETGLLQATHVHSSTSRLEELDEDELEEAPGWLDKDGASVVCQQWLEWKEVASLTIRLRQADVRLSNIGIRS